MATGIAADVVMPQMGVSVAEGTVTKWLKSEGDAVAADEPLLEISTDKVDTEVPCPASGVLGQILVQEGETVAVGTRLATILPEGAEPPSQPSDEPPPEPTLVGAGPAPPVLAGHARPDTPPEITGSVAEQSVPDPGPALEPTTPPSDEADGHGEGRAFVSPVVARIAAEHGVDVTQIAGTGRGGRVTKKDILQFLESHEAALQELEEEEVPAALLQPEITPPTPAAPAAAPAAAGELVEPMTVMRKAIAEHMVRSAATSAHVTTVFEVDMAKITAIREKLKREYEERHGVRLTYLAFISRAVVDTLGKWPRLNAEIRGDQIVTKSYVNLGIAVALDDGKGLIVPVIRNAEERNLLGIARAIVDLADRARSKKLLPDEVHGGTFTITNPGGFGAIAGTPIINQPQVGILDVEAIVKRPVVVTDEHGNDAIAIRPMMNLCLSYDHRLVDGAYAAPFMRDLRTCLETWDEDAY